MANLSTTYLGKKLDNPIVAGASSLTSHMSTIKRIEDAGAGALVVASLFEEQVTIDKQKLSESLHANDDHYAEMTTIFPDIEHAGPDEHLHWVAKAKEAVSIPVFASLNAVETETWVEWSKKIEQTGVDGIELNFYALPLDFEKSAREIEQEQIRTIKRVKQELTIPVSVKLSSFYTNPLKFIKELDSAGADGLVLFNRLFQPTFRVESETNDFSYNLSNPNDHRLALRFAGILFNRTKATICGSNGVSSSDDIIKLIMAGADAVQIVSLLFKRSIDIIRRLLREIDSWMDDKGYTDLDGFRGKLSMQNNPDPLTYKRGQYIRGTMRPDEYMRGRIT